MGNEKNLPASLILVRRPVTLPAAAGGPTSAVAQPSVVPATQRQPPLLPLPSRLTPSSSVTGPIQPTSSPAGVPPLLTARPPKGERSVTLPDIRPSLAIPAPLPVQVRSPLAPLPPTPLQSRPSLTQPLPAPLQVRPALNQPPTLASLAVRAPAVAEQVAPIQPRPSTQLSRFHYGKGPTKVSEL